MVNHPTLFLDTTSQDLLDQVGSMVRSENSQTREPNLNDVVDFLSSEDLGLVSNAASYLQHLAYGDDSMKAKIRSVLFPCWYEVWEPNRMSHDNSLTTELDKTCIPCPTNLFGYLMHEYLMCHKACVINLPLIKFCGTALTRRIHNIVTFGWDCHVC